MAKRKTYGGAKSGQYRGVQLSEPHPANWPRPKLAMNQCGACLPSKTKRLCLTFRCSPERLGRVLPNLHARDDRLDVLIARLFTVNVVNDIGEVIA